MKNRLAHETSPYLLQHQDNPVDWYPWNAEALAKAQADDKPILLSIGYSACHWCHVMAHESFEDETIAALMNQLFVNIKVDREERPDLDAIYMDAVTAMTGHGGWPMTVFLTPQGVPFYGGTYYPPEPRYGMPAFPQVLRAVAAAYAEQREGIELQGQELLTHIRQRSQLPTRADNLTPDILNRAFENLMRMFDARWGGFGTSGPKFPQPMVLEFVLRYYARSLDIRARRVLDTTLTRMAFGGMYDQVGGGFARYSVDEKWLIPHFEKMLYDNGQLISLYLHAWQQFGTPLYRRIAEESLAYLRREMLDSAGGFYSSQDADSEGEEGKFFVWTVAEIDAALTPEEGRIVKAYYGVTAGGNFEGHNVLWIPSDPAVVAANLNLSEQVMHARLNTARTKLFHKRVERIAPGTDTKVLTSWSSLAITAFAEAGRILGDEAYTRIAVQTATFILEQMRNEEAHLLRTWKGGEAKLNGYLEDYACLAHALITLYEATFESSWLDEAVTLVETMLAEFKDENGGFYDTASYHEQLVVRPKDVVDNAMPSGNAMAAVALLKLGAYLDKPQYREIARESLQLVGLAVGEQPNGFGHWLVALDWHLTPTIELALIGSKEEVAPFVHEIYRRYLPNKIIAHAADNQQAQNLSPLIPLLQNRTMLNDQPTAYLCEHMVCQRPVTRAEELATQLDSRAQ